MNCVAYRVPVDAVLFRGQTPYFFAVRQQPTELKAVFWNLGPQPDFFAKQVPLSKFIEQEGELIVPEIREEDRHLVVRGQHRLVDGRRVRIVNLETSASSSTARRAASSPANRAQ